MQIVMENKTVDLFVNAVDSVMSSMSGIHASLKDEGKKHRRTPLGAITGVIDMSTESQPGSMALSFSESLALALTEKILQLRVSRINEEVEQLVAEMTNMICGSAKHPLHETGIDIGFATPQILKGRRRGIPHALATPATLLTLETDEGALYLELSLNYQFIA